MLNNMEKQRRLKSCLFSGSESCLQIVSTYKPAIVIVAVSSFPKVSMWKCKNSSVPVSRFHYLRDYTELSPACDALPRLTLVSPPPLSSSPPDGENNENMFPAPDFVLQIIILVTLQYKLEDIPAIVYIFHEIDHDSES